MNDQTGGNDPGVAAPDNTTAAARFRPLRTWPSMLLVALMVVARFGPTYLEGGGSSYWMITVFGPLLCCPLILICWLTASRATWKERLFGSLALVGSLKFTLMLVHPTMRGPGTINLTVPMGMAAFALSALWLRNSRPLRRTGGAVLIALAGFGYSLLLRNEGMTGNYALGMRWRWSQTSEALMLASGNEETAATTHRPDADKINASLAQPEWPGFRGEHRTARSQGPQLSTNWSAHPPRQLWKIPVGPGWSSFAVADKLLFTQEQRGPMETVVCYEADSGHEVWSRQFEARLEDPLGGPGPRATPTLADGALFVTGATGTFLRLNSATGEIVWQLDLKEIAGRAVPVWGFAASPLVVGSNVIVYAGGPGNKGVLAFDTTSGMLRWSAASGADSYSSPELDTIAGVDFVLMLSNDGVVLLDPATGREQLNYELKVTGYSALQPHLVGDDTVLLPSGINTGMRAIRVTRNNGQLAAQELWTSKNLKPDFTDFVTHQGFAYGNDGGIFACVDLKTGDRKWKGGRYGKGQVLLLEDSGLLLVSAEDGRVVLLRADPSEHAEVASFKALEGKTWNHPVVIGDRLYVRNSQEAACYQLPLAEAKEKAESKQP